MDDNNGGAERNFLQPRGDNRGAEKLPNRAISALPAIAEAIEVNERVGVAVKDQALLDRTTTEIGACAFDKAVETECEQTTKGRKTSNRAGMLRRLMQLFYPFARKAENIALANMNGEVADSAEEQTETLRQHVGKCLCGEGGRRIEHKQLP